MFAILEPMIENERKAFQQLAHKLAVLDEAYTHLALRCEEMATRLAALENRHTPRRHDA